MKPLARIAAVIAAAILAAWLVTGCANGPSVVVATTATIATVQTLDAGIAAFASWDLLEERNIADKAVALCKGGKAPDYMPCVNAYVSPKRAPIDKAKSAIHVYRAALAAGSAVSTSDVDAAAQAVVSALAALGIKVTP